MKFSLLSFVSATIGYFSVSHAGLIKRQEPVDIRTYYNNVDIDVFSGLWHVSGVGQSSSNETHYFNDLISMFDCVWMNISKADNLTMHTVNHISYAHDMSATPDSMTATANYTLIAPTSDVNVTGHEILWTMSEVGLVRILNLLSIGDPSWTRTYPYYTKWLYTGSDVLDTFAQWVTYPSLLNPADPPIVYVLIYTKASVMINATFNQTAAQLPSGLTTKEIFSAC